MEVDHVFVNGNVFDGRRHRPDTAVGVSDGRIVAVGGTREIRELAGTRRKETDLAGGLLTPGFTEAHIHPTRGGMERRQCDVSDASDREDTLRMVRKYALRNSGSEWIIGAGWELAHFPGGVARASDLDSVVPDRPVCLTNSDHHGAWVNSRAMELAGIDSSTPDPPKGRIDGTRTGTRSAPCRRPRWRWCCRCSRPRRTRRWRPVCSTRRGSCTPSGSPAGRTRCSATSRTCPTPARSTCGWPGTGGSPPDRGLDQLPDLVDRRERYQHGRFRATSVKIMQDGIPEIHSAGAHEPYFDSYGCPTSERGNSYVDPDLLRAAAAELDSAGFQIHVHAIGDRAVSEMLDGFAEAREKNGSNDRRHQMAHLQMVRPDDVPRFAALGVAANMQALWLTYDKKMVALTEPILGSRRSAQQYPFASLAATGARLAGGSDWPVSTPDPLAAAHVAVNRRMPPALGDGDYPRDPFLGPAEEIADARVLATYVDGAEVFSR